MEAQLDPVPDSDPLAIASVEVESVGNYVFRLTSEARTDRSSVGYKFRDGLGINESDEILNHFSEARKRVRDGYNKFPQRDELFKAYLESRTRSENSIDPEDCAKASHYSWTHVSECINNLLDQKRHAFAFLNIDGAYHIAGSEFQPNSASIFTLLPKEILVICQIYCFPLPILLPLNLSRCPSRARGSL